MEYSYDGEDIEQFLTGYMDTVEGPANGRIAHRVGKRWRIQIPDPSFTWSELCSAGIHLTLRISAPTSVTFMVYEQYAMPDTFAVLHHEHGRNVVDNIRAQGAGRYVSSPDGSFTLQKGSPCVIRLVPNAGGQGEYTIILPHTCATEVVSIVSEAPVYPLEAATDRPRWTHYGSSISHGMQVASPADRWPERVAASLDLSLADLSVSGNAQIDAAVARTIAGIPADVITCSIGINLVNADSMRERAFVPALHGFLDIIRDSQPKTLVVLMTAGSCPVQEHTPGPAFLNDDGYFVTARRDIEHDEGALTLQRTRELIDDVYATRHDAHMRLVDGRELFGPNDVGLLDDHLHPNPEGVDLMARRMGALMRRILNEEVRTHV